MGKTALYSFLFSFALGIAVRSRISLGIAFPLFLFLLAAAFIFFERLLSSSRLPLLFFISVSLASFSLGVLRFDLAEKKDSPVDAFLDKSAVFEGVIVDEPDVRENNVHLTVEIRSLVEGENSRAIEGGKALLITAFFPEFHYGDRIRFRGVLQIPENFSSDSGRVFDYRSYLAKDGILYEMYRPSIEGIGGGAGNPVKKYLFLLKETFMTRLHRFIPEPESSLAGGLIIGTRSSLGKELLDDFRTTGVIHIVALSGYNITIVAESVMKVLGLFLPRSLGMAFGSLAIIAFAVMTGGSATVVRASIMALLVILARATGRTYDITRALLVAGFLMVLQNPLLLIFDPSFQLSFLATLGLIIVTPLITPYFSFLPERFKFREIIVSTFATQIFVLPMILYMTGTLSLVAPIVNLLILPLIPLTMLVSFLAGSTAFIVSFLAYPFALVAHGLLWYELFIVRLFARLPFAAITVPAFPALILALWYAGYAAFYFWKKNTERKRATPVASLHVIASSDIDMEVPH